MFLVDVAVGTAVIALPQGRLPVLGLTAAVQGFKASQRRKAQKAQQADSDDAEAAVPGQGSVAPATLTFEHVTSKIERKGSAKTILDDVSGTAQPGRLLALMGPSGSGKTSLLNALARHTPVTTGMTLSGRLHINGRDPAAKGAPRTGYVQQEDLFYSQMTVQETLDMVAALRLPRAMTREARRGAVDEVIGMLDLTAVRDTVVGDRKTRGISGGEKKRLSIACELLSAPSLIFLDEPTTGLDAFQALKVVQALKKLAGAGHTVVAAIHQPRSRIFELFDDLLLLSQGQLVYGGTAQGALEHFAGLGHECPEHYNPAEFLADLISIDQSSEEAMQESKQQLEQLISKRAEQDVQAAASDAAEAAQGAPPVAPPEPPLGLQLNTLFKRSWKQVTRDKAAVKLRVLTNVQSALVFGTIWWRLRRIQKAVASRFGMLQVIAVYTSQTALFKTLNLFPPEKQLVQTERAKGSYSVLPYFLSKVLAELPTLAVYPLVHSAIVYPMTGLQPGVGKFAKYASSNIVEALGATALGMAVGAVAPSTEAALVIGPAVMLVFIVFGGLYTNPDDMPAYLKWLPDTSGIKVGYDALVKNEFQGLELQKEGLLSGYSDGDQVLKARGFRGGVADSVAQQGRITLFHWWLTYCILKAKKPTFQPMVPPEDTASTGSNGADNGAGNGAA